MAIEIKEKKRRKIISLPDSISILFYYSILILLLTVGTYFFLRQWNEEIQSEISHMTNLMEDLEEESRFEENQKIVLSRREQIDNYLHAFWSRNDSNKIFSLLEEAVHPMANLDEVSLNLKDETLTINGRAHDFYTVEQQYSILKEFTTKRDFYGWVSEYHPAPTDEEDYLVHLDMATEEDDWEKIVEEWDDFGEVEIFEQEMSDGGVRQVIFSVTEDEMGEKEYERFEKNVELTTVDDQERVVPLRSATEISSSPFEGTRIVTLTDEDSKPFLLTEVKTEDYRIRGEETLDWDWYEVRAEKKINPIENVELEEMNETEEGRISFQFSSDIDPLIFKP